MIFRQQAVLLTASFLIACGDDALDTVKVCGSLAVPDDLVAVRVVVLDENLRELSAGVASLDGTSARQLPVEVSVAHHGGVRVFRAQALSADEAEIGRAEVLVASGSTLDTVVLNLTRDCLGFTCSLGQTCIDGSCTIIPDAAAVHGRCDSGATP